MENLVHNNVLNSVRRCVAAALLVPTLVASTVLFLSSQASATPGGNNFALFVGNGGDPTNGTMYFYDNGSQAGSSRAGSGTSVVSENSPCNKYWGLGDGNQGGRIPPTSGYSTYDSPWPGWSTTSAPYNPGLRLSNGVATGSTFDCAGTGSITRDGLWVHNWNNNFVTQGCIKMDNTNMFYFGIRFHDIWGGSDGVAYYGTLGSW
jgi:hypothetical protein